MAVPGALGGLGEYVETAAMSFSFFLMMIPTLNESLSRLPPSNPIGQGPDSPPVQTAVTIALLVFVATVAAFAGDGSVWGRSAIRGTVTVTVTILVSVTVLTLVVWLFEAVGMATGTA